MTSNSGLWYNRFTWDLDVLITHQETWKLGEGAYYNGSFSDDFLESIKFDSPGWEFCLLPATESPHSLGWDSMETGKGRLARRLTWEVADRYIMTLQWESRCWEYNDPRVVQSLPGWEFHLNDRVRYVVDSCVVLAPWVRAYSQKIMAEVSIMLWIKEFIEEWGEFFHSEEMSYCGTTSIKPFTPDKANPDIPQCCKIWSTYYCNRKWEEFIMKQRELQNKDSGKLLEVLNHMQGIGTDVYDAVLTQNGNNKKWVQVDDVWKILINRFQLSRSGYLSAITWQISCPEEVIIRSSTPTFLNSSWIDKIGFGLGPNKQTWFYSQERSLSDADMTVPFLFYT